MRSQQKKTHYFYSLNVAQMCLCSLDQNNSQRRRLDLIVNPIKRERIATVKSSA